MKKKYDNQINITVENNTNITEVLNRLNICGFYYDTNLALDFAIKENNNFLTNLGDILSVLLWRK